jgi:hypothetical protein
MATLLILQYKSFKKLPDSLSEFYDTLFLALLQRHDGTKPGFRRQRRCPLDDTQYRHVFETICILAKKSNQQIYNQKTIYKITEEAIKNCNVEANPADFIEDIIKITCLILREGVEYRFIHKTVQEYYTASYIQRKPESWRETLYSRIKIKKIHVHWNQELQFLREIDKYHYNKFYFLPTAIEFFGITIDDLKVGHKPSILSVSKEQLKDLIVGVHGFPPRFSFYVPKQNFFADNFTRLMIDPFTRYNHPPDILSKNIVDYSEKILTEFPQAHFTEGIEHKNKLSGKFVRIKFSDLIDKLPYINEILASCQNYFDQLFEEASLMLISMQDADDESLLEGLV